MVIKSVLIGVFTALIRATHRNCEVIEINLKMNSVKKSFNKADTALKLTACTND